MLEHLVTHESRRLPDAALIRWYYLGTLLFVLLDYLLGISFRVTFLDPWPAWKAAYYAGCLLLLAVMSVRPSLSLLLAGVESLLTMAALILSMWVRVMFVSDELLDGGRGVVSVAEVVNFVIAGVVAWLAWQRSVRALQRRGNRR